MKRSAALAPLSRDHQHALDAALRLRRATAADTQAAVKHFLAFWTAEGTRHFEIEEDHLLGALPRDGDWADAVDRVERDHADIRAMAAELAAGPAAEATGLAHRLGARLHDHVRFEERELFRLLEERLAEDELRRLGARVVAAEAASRDVG
jgi:hemerythrin HHE cation binding domain-containing protein